MEAIDYATRERQHGWLRRHLRGIVVVAVLAAVAIGGYRVRKPAADYVRWQYWHWQLSRYAMSPRDAIAPPTRVPTSRTAGTRHVASPLVGLRSNIWVICDSMAYGDGAYGYDYVGQRSRPDGASRTVVIALRPEMNFPFAGATTRVYRRPGWFERPPRLDFGCGGSLALAANPWPALVECIDDPADASSLLVTLHPAVPTDQRPFAPTRLRVRLTDADVLDWTLESCDERTKPEWVPVTPKASPAATRS